MVSTFLTAAMAATLAHSPAPQATRPAPAPAITAAAPQVDNPWVHLLSNLGRDLQAFVAPETAGVLIGGGVAALALHANADNRARTSVLKQPVLDPGLTKFGNVYGNAPQPIGAIAVWGLGKATRHTSMEATGAVLIRAQLLNGLLTQGLKLASQRERPNGGRHSFPSGHTSATFTTAAVLEARHGWAVALPAYALGGFVAWSRVRSNHHWVSDVVFGAALGTASGYAANRGATRQWSVVPVKTPGGGAIYLVKR